MRRALTFLVAASLSLSMSFSAFAGTWKQDAKGWWYQNDDGSYASSGWKEIDGKWYFFTPEGYILTGVWHGDYYLSADGAMLTSTTTPDGYKVGADGKYIAGGQQQQASTHIQSAPYEGYKYIVNTKSNVFHHPHCRGVKTMTDENKGYADDKEALKSQGYKSCGICNP